MGLTLLRGFTGFYLRVGGFDLVEGEHCIGFSDMHVKIRGIGGIAKLDRLPVARLGGEDGW